MNNSPKVTIGLPVFNGEKYLSHAIDSVLSQTFTDFELIVSDNASTDRTEEICKAYAAKDKRIRYYRNERNLGAVGNINRIMKLATGEYFQWFCYDDIMASTYIERSTAILERDPTIVLCHCRNLMLDEQGRITRDPERETIFNPSAKTNFESSLPQERFREVLLGEQYEFSYLVGFLFGLIRTVSLRRIGPVPAFIDHDRAYLAKLSLAGRFYELPDRLFFVRFHAEQISCALGDPSVNKSQWKIFLDLYQGFYQYTLRLNPMHKRITIFPRWRLLFEYISAIQKSQLSWNEQWQCYLSIGRWLQQWWKGGLLLDLMMASVRIIGLMRLPKEELKMKNTISPASS
jgi:glycosyltransferase involved in cell wall biosynthesis